MRVVSQIVLFLFSLSVLVGSSQEKEFNFIISVDGRLTSVYADEFIIRDKNNEKKIIRVSYTPGRLSIKESDYEKLISGNVGSIDLLGHYFTHCKDEISNRSFEIEDFKLAWLNKGYFFILYIYDTNNKKYRKIYDPLPGKEFTYDYDWSEGSMRRVQKKFTREQKKCLGKLETETSN